MDQKCGPESVVSSLSLILIHLWISLWDGISIRDSESRPWWYAKIAIWTVLDMLFRRKKNSTDIILLQIRDGSHCFWHLTYSTVSERFFSLIEGLSSELFFCRILLLKVLLRNIGHDREKSIGDSHVQHFSLPLEEGHVKVKCVKLGNLCRIILWYSTLWFLLRIG